MWGDVFGCRDFDFQHSNFEEEMKSAWEEYESSKVGFEILVFGFDRFFALCYVVFMVKLFLFINFGTYH